MSSAIATYTGRFTVLTSGATPIGILLEDTDNNALHVRLRRDWGTFADDEEREVLELLENDLLSKAREMGADGVLSWLEENASNMFQVTNRESVLADDFPRTLNRLYRQRVRSNAVPFQTHLPRYSLRAAAGKFLDNEEIVEEGWEEIPRDLHALRTMFIAEIAGHSMEPRIPDGSLCVFRGGIEGARTGLLVLAESLESTGTNRYAIKRYRSEKTANDESWMHTRIRLESLNPEYPSWDLEPEEGKYRIIAEFIRVLD
jgi:phage repressor protein C with HTH and peptisase S24 domain